MALRENICKIYSVVKAADRELTIGILEKHADARGRLREPSNLAYICMAECLEQLHAFGDVISVCVRLELIFLDYFRSHLPIYEQGPVSTKKSTSANLQ